MEEQVVTQETVSNEPVTQAQPTIQEVNLAAMRKRLEAEEEARKQAERRLQELEKQVINRPVAPVPESDDIEGDPDDYLQVKHYKKTASKLVSKVSETEKRYQELEQRVERYEAENALKDLKDFNEVVNDENLRTLEKLYPEEYGAIMANNNLKTKAKIAYNTMKNYGIYSKTTNDNAQKIEKNKQKPTNPGSAGQSAPTPLSRLNDYDRRTMTEEDRDRVLAYLERVKRGG